MSKKKVCSGLDVHKETIFAAINVDGKTSEVREFSTLTSEIRLMADWLQSEGVVSIAMESTGIYWVPIWNILEEYRFKLILVNPYFIKQMPGRKSDVKDSQWIAQLLAKDLLKSSLVPCKTIRELRAYSREYVKRQQNITRIVQSMERILESANIRITSMVARIEGKAVLGIIDLLISGETSADKLLEKVHTRTLNRKGEQVRKSLEGAIHSEHIFLLKQRMEEYDLNCRHATDLEKEMEKICLGACRTRYIVGNN